MTINVIKAFAEYRDYMASPENVIWIDGAKSTNCGYRRKPSMVKFSGPPSSLGHIDLDVPSNPQKLHTTRLVVDHSGACTHHICMVNA